jgi:hypothetical protein
MSNKFKDMLMITFCFYIAVIAAFMAYYEHQEIFIKNTRLYNLFWISYAFFNISLISSLIIPYIFA